MYNSPHMVITYLGGGFIKITSGETTLAVNPISKDSSLKQSRFKADVVLVSMNHPDFNGIENVTHGEPGPFVIDGPGEYEVRKMIIRGLQSETNYDKNYHIHTLFIVTIENSKLCFLGAHSNPKLSPNLTEALDGVDILFMPIGGNGTLNATEAHNLGVDIGPHIYIPTFFDDASLKTFLKEEGGKEVTPIEKFTFKKKDLEGREGDIIVLGKK